jgi:hypothetical protein
MKKNLNLQIALASTLAILSLAGIVSAQSTSQAAADKQALIQKLEQLDASLAGAQAGAVAFSVSGAGDMKSITGAPYSAQVTTESVQPFSDGNYISHKTVSTVYRDSLGRIRREQNITLVGPSDASGSAIQFITINDPVTGSFYNLNPRTKTYVAIGNAKFISPLPVITEAGSGVPMTFSYSVDAATAGNGGGGVGRGGALVPAKIASAGCAEGQITTKSTTSVMGQVVNSTTCGGNITTENLGADTMSGLSVIGTRTTNTIPAGQIGNAQPILVTTDQWYSPDLQINIMTKHSDPRTGTTTTTLTNVSRNEPDPGLFTVPPGYTLSSSTAPKVVFKQQDLPLQ